MKAVKLHRDSGAGWYLYVFVRRLSAKFGYFFEKNHFTLFQFCSLSVYHNVHILTKLSAMKEYKMYQQKKERSTEKAWNCKTHTQKCEKNTISTFAHVIGGDLHIKNFYSSRQLGLFSCSGWKILRIIVNVVPAAAAPPHGLHL